MTEPTPPADLAADEAPARNRRPAKPAVAPRRKRQFAAELAALQSRVDTALKILTRCTGEGAVSKELAALAVDILKGDDA